MVDALVFVALVFSSVGAGLSLVAWRDETRVARLLARDRHPMSYANRPRPDTTSAAGTTDPDREGRS